MSSTIVLPDFSLGLNLRDSATELDLRETPDAANWTLDTRGQARLRKGSLNVATLPGTSGKPAYIFYSAALDLWFCARETFATLRVHTRPGDLSGSWTLRGELNGDPAAVAAFVDFPGATPKVVMASANAQGVGGTPGGVWTWDGTTFASMSTTIAGYALALWQNRVWLAGYRANDANGNPTRLFASAIGDPTTWATASGGLTVDLRDKDAARLTALGIAGGALVAFKRRSAYRVTDSGLGTYVTIDAAAGCMGPLSLVALRGRLYSWGADSIYEWDGVSAGKRVGDKARPLFATDPALVGGVPGLAGGAVEDRALFGYPHSAGGNNDRLLEYDPEHGWLMRHQLASTSKDEVSSFARKEADLYAAIADGDVMFKIFSETPGADDGTLFASNNFRTPWLAPNAGRVARLNKVIVRGLTVTGGTTTFKLRVYKDYDLSSYDEYDLSSDLRGGDAADQVETSIVQSLGHSRAFALEVVAGTAAGAAVLDSFTLDPRALEV